MIQQQNALIDTQEELIEEVNQTEKDLLQKRANLQQKNAHHVVSELNDRQKVNVSHHQTNESTATKQKKVQDSL